MRSDMGKVLVERPRVRCRFVRGLCGKGYNSRVREEMVSDDGSPSREGTMRRYNNRGDKYFNEHLGPLRRFIESNVGRPWDKVYGEICKYVDQGNVVQKHILTHLFEYVAVDVDMIDGEPHHKPHQFRYSHSAVRGPNQWYVCPKSGLLKRAKPEPRRKRRERLVPGRLVAWLSKSDFVLQCETGWRRVTVKPIPEAVRGSPDPGRTVFDVLFRVSVPSCNDSGRLAGFYGKSVYAVDVRDIRRADLKHLPVTLPRKLKAPNVVR